MTKSKFFLIMFLSMLGTSAIVAQSRVALHGSGQVTIFSGTAPFVDAYNAASSGDTIYLPGGGFTAPVEINKSITVFGAGHYPDSNAVTYQTSVGGNITIRTGANNLRLEGIFFTGNISFAGNEKVDNVVIVRCRINGTLAYNGSTPPTTPCENHQIIQSVLIGDLTLDNLTGSTISNCILQNAIIRGNNLFITNNVFLRSNYYPGSYVIPAFNGITGSTITNNVLLGTSYTSYWQGGCTACLFVNNLLPVAATDNYNTTAGLMCINSNSVFDYTKDYHLQDPETYVGTDGTQVGIYGGAVGYKPGAVPSNPHFSSAVIAPTTDDEGKLNVNIQVIAQ